MFKTVLWIDAEPWTEQQVEWADRLKGVLRMPADTPDADLLGGVVRGNYHWAEVLGRMCRENNAQAVVVRADDLTPRFCTWMFARTKKFYDGQLGMAAEVWVDVGQGAGYEVVGHL